MMIAAFDVHYLLTDEHRRGRCFSTNIPIPNLP
jgi:hypothetical protein